MPTDTRHPAPTRMVGPLGLTRAGIEAAQAADVSDEARAAECWCSTRVYVDYLDGATCCPRHGDTADARKYRGTWLCECGREETTAHAHTVTWPTHSYRLCRVCSTCASCRRRAEVVDGDLCAACADARDAALEQSAGQEGGECPPRPGISPSFYR